MQLFILLSFILLRVQKKLKNKSMETRDYIQDLEERYKQYCNKKSGVSFNRNTDIFMEELYSMPIAKITIEELLREYPVKDEKFTFRQNKDATLKLDSETNIVVDSDENGDYLDVKLEEKIISITATYRPELMGTTGQYIVTAVLEKEGFDTAIVPINVSVLYFDGSDGTKNYEELRNLPKINGNVLLGDRSLSELGIQEEMNAISNSDIDNIIN